MEFVTATKIFQSGIMPCFENGRHGSLGKMRDSPGIIVHRYGRCWRVGGDKFSFAYSMAEYDIGDEFVKEGEQRQRLMSLLELKFRFALPDELVDQAQKKELHAQILKHINDHSQFHPL